MICPKCHKRMTCVNSFNESETMRTAREYRCQCSNRVYTMETQHDPIEVYYTLLKRQQKERKNK